MMNQVKHYNEMIEGINESVKKNLETIKNTAKTRIENAEQTVAKTTDTQFTYFVSTLNQLTNNYLNYFASNMNNINAGWHNLTKEREQIKNICVSSIDSAYDNFIKHMPASIIDEIETETRPEPKAEVKTETRTEAKAETVKPGRK